MRRISAFCLTVLPVLVLACCENKEDSGGGHKGRPNRAPVFVSGPITHAFADEAYLYDAEAEDADKDELTYSLAAGPGDMTIDSASGLVNWLPGPSAVGNHWLEVRASDGETTVSQYFTVRVDPTDNGIPFQRGAVLTSWWHDDYSQELTEETVLRMKENGCDWISILFTWYQDTLDSTTIGPSPDKSPTDAGVIRITQYAHSLGLKVFYKPHIDIHTGQWNGFISFATDEEWNAWFDSYDGFVGHYLEMAESNSVEGFVIGTELKNTEGRESNWRNTIALARSKYSGFLTYSANHDSYYGVMWWDDLDFIGVSGYFRLTTKADPTMEELLAGWDTRKTTLHDVAVYWGKDIVFTEVGYQSRNGANVTPWWTDGVYDAQEQADCYQALYTSLYNEPWFKGIYWWMYYWDPLQDVNGFDIYGKPAEDIFIYWYAGR